MKKQYITPLVEIVEVCTESVMQTTSTVVTVSVDSSTTLEKDGDVGAKESETSFDLWDE